MKKIIIFICIVIIAGLIFLVQKNHKNQLLKPFNETEKKWIQTLTKVDQTYFLEQKPLHKIFKEKDFKVEQFRNYVNFYKQNKSASMKQIVSTVNSKPQIKTDVAYLQAFQKEAGFELDKIDRYIAYQEKNPTLSSSKVVTLVNGNIDAISEIYDETIDKFLNAEYFVKENLTRYLKYQKNKKTDVKTTIAHINSNLDSNYYTNIKKTDISKGSKMIVNKYYALESNYIPNNLVSIDKQYGYSSQIQKEAYEAFQKLVLNAKEQGFNFYIRSAYKSYQVQKNLYELYCAQEKQEVTDTHFARPGHSEYQTGYALDIVSELNNSLNSFENTKESEWLKANAHKFGFILRFPKGKEKITGFKAEPWHYRYAGLEVAKEIYEKDITFEEYYGYYLK